jgi:hypothetical protein
MHDMGVAGSTMKGVTAAVALHTKSYPFARIP